MSSLNTPSPVGDTSSVASLNQGLLLGHRGEVKKTGNLKKLKTNKRKYFVLRCESADYPARLEYYDSEKKFRAQQQPKRSISLKACFNINKRNDMKSKYVIALYTRDDCFCIVLDSEEERESWLRALLTLQDGDDVTDGETPKPVFEHVWKVDVANRGLGATRNLHGPYHLCLTGRTVSLVKIYPDGSKDVLEFPLQNIRSFGSLESFFRMEVGRNAVTGTGEIWMEAEDAVIAQEIIRAIDAMRTRVDDGSSRQIGRSASVSESSRPITVSSRRHNNSVTENHEETRSSAHASTNETSSGYMSNTDSYCEMTRAPGRFMTADHAVSVSTPGAAGCWSSGCKGSAGGAPAPCTVAGAGTGMGTAGSTTTPLLVHHQRTYSFPLSPLPPSTSVRRGSAGTKAGLGLGHSHSGQRASGTSLSSAHCSSVGRDRSDSLPSSVRTSSENHTFSHGPVASHGHHPHHPPGRSMHSHFSSAYHRPHSMYIRGISHSPPVIASSPVSPASGACSTDSAGSSLSIDEGDNWVDGSDVTLSSMPSRFASNHPLTPESPIEEENCDDQGGDDYVHWNGPSGLDSGVGDDEKMNNYMPMDRSSATLSLPIQQPHTGPSRKFSPGRSTVGSNLNTGTSPSHSNYMEMNSPCGSSPMEPPGNYMMMSPGNAPGNVSFYNRGIQQMHTAPSSANHSRTSSLAEETPDGYVPMAPSQTDDGYVDMDPSHADAHDDFHHGEMSPSSSCSITSGTPSTDLRFSEYPLEKVNSYLTPSEEEEIGERPTRCYSVGSKPDSLNKKNRVDLVNQTDCSRVRAFSVGSRNAPGSKYMSRPLGHDLHATRQSGGHFNLISQQRQQQQQQTGSGKKSSSAPILSNSLSSSPMNRHILGGSHSSVDPLDDLMEMDFSPSVSNSSQNTRNSKSSGKPGGRSKSTTVNEYVSMLPGDRLSVPSGGGGGASHHSSQSSVASSYSTAEGVDVCGIHMGSPRAYDSIGPGSPPKPSVLRSVYSNAIGRSPPDNVARSPPSRSTASPRSAVTRMSCISELKPQNFPMTTPSPPIKQSLLATNNSASSMAAKMAKMAVSSPYVEMNPSNATSKPVIATSSASKPPSDTAPYVEMKSRTLSGSSSSGKQNNLPPASNNEDYMDMSFKPRKTSISESKDLNRPTATDGYVEMGWKPSNESEVEKPRKSSLDSPRSTSNDDYMLMSGGSGSLSRNRRERKGSTKRERNQLRSQPINIQQTQQNRKMVMDTPPKAPPGFLPLATSLESQSPSTSPFSSLGRNRNRKSSKDSSSTASDLTTPTGSNSTIFPLSLNSPGSPLKPFSSDSPSGVTVPSTSFDKLEKVPADMSSGTLRLSYPHAEEPKLPTTPSNKQDPPKHDYVNFNPNSDSEDTSLKGDSADDAGDYAIMCPGSSTVSRKVEPQKKMGLCSSRIGSKFSSDNDSGPSRPTDYSRPLSKPLTVSGLLGMNNLSPTSASEPQNILNLSSASTSMLSLGRQVSMGCTIPEKKLQNCDSDLCASGTSKENTQSALNNTKQEVDGNKSCSDGAAGVTTSSLGQLSQAGPNTPIVYSSPNLSPCPSPSPNPSPFSEGSSSHISPASTSSGGGLREKKMSSGSDSSTASRDSQLLIRKYSTGSVSPTSSKSRSTGTNDKANTPASRRLSCPSKSSVSRQVSLSSDISDASQTEESRISDSVTSLSRQTSSSSTSGEASSSSTLALTEKRSLSCSPVPSSASPVPRTAEREINYASLDLRIGSEADDSSIRSPRGLKTQGSLSESQSSTSSPSPNPPGGTFTYAQIDFEKSEDLRKLSAAKSVKQ
ncbi:serine-rich adhesin for platelets isoform X2 [Frankliniella occidentalis]|uniref:Insulin receptor substrate 1 n=1 Tax=Frankliniella occidentalis TaxID=133901 RepID=A0A6J1TMT9_FRAOC|nr:serine-rich adhesin for platelets isoform X2 [Frankliniella occidentalis]